MKTFTLFLIVLFAITKTQATPPPDFTMTDIEGVTYNLYAELDKGKPVIIVFFNVSCGTCQAAVPTLEQIWLQNAMQGQIGWVWAMENGNASVERIESYFEEFGGTFKAFRTADDDSILTEQYGYNITYTPQYYIVCNRDSYKTVWYDTILEVFNGCDTQVGVEEDSYKPLSINSNGFDISISNIPSAKTTNVKMIDILGRVISDQNIYNSAPEISIPKPNLNGIYIVNLQQDNGRSIAKKILIK